MNTEYIRQLRASQAALSEKADAIIKAGEKRGHFTDSERSSLKSMEAEMQTLKSDLDQALDPATAELWRGLTPLGRNEFVCWVEDAKKPETRQRRIRRTEEEMHEGKRRPCCWPGCKHRERAGR